MKTIYFYTPLGIDIHNPKMSKLKSLILCGGKDYWCQGNGQGVLKFSSSNIVDSEITLTYSKNYGFQVEFFDLDKIYYVSIGKGDFNNTVITYVGGDEWLLPSKFFISVEETWKVIEEFYVSGKKTSEINWGILSEQNWNYGF